MPKHKFKVGDVVQITKAHHKYFSVCDIGTIYMIDLVGDHWVDFNNHMNNNVYGDGQWCVGDNRPNNYYGNFELVDAAPISEEVEVSLDEPNRN